MSFRWTETLVEPFRSATQRGEWRLVHESRGGAGLLLSDESKYDVCWYRVNDANAEPVALNPLEDEDLGQIGPILGDWLRHGREVQLLAWRVGRRAIFRVRTELGSRILKVYRKDRQLLERWQSLANAETADWRVPRVLEWNKQQRLLTMEDCCGVSLNRRWLSGRGVLEDGDTVAGVLRWLAGARVPASFPRHGIDDETRLLRGRLEAYNRTLARPSPAATDIVERVIHELENDPVSESLFCHRDLHDKQLLLDGSGGTLIDLDLAAAGPPALDPGNLLAHLRLRELKGARLPWKKIAIRIVNGCMESRHIEDSLHRWTAAALTRLALIYSRRRRMPDLLDRLLVSSEQALDRTGEWREIFDTGASERTTPSRFERSQRAGQP